MSDAALAVLAQQFANGIILGSIYALIALGYTMVYGILGLINFAHGEVTMMGAMVAISVMNALLLSATGMPLALIVLSSLVIAIMACMSLGYVIERVAYRPLRKAPRLAPLITAIGVSIVLQNVAMLFWGRGYQPFPAIFSNQSFTFLGATVTPVKLAIVVIAAVVMALLLVLVNKTKLGRAMRATAQNPDVAVLMGVDVNKVISTTFVLGSALGALAGVMVSANYGQAEPYMGFMLGLKAFSAAVLGGIGSLAGAMLGGILLGLIESFGGGYLGDLTGGVLGSNYQDIFAFIVLIAVLVFKPSGLLGAKVVDRA